MRIKIEIKFQLTYKYKKEIHEKENKLRYAESDRDKLKKGKII